MRDRFFGPMWGLVAVGLFLLWLALASGGCAKPRPTDQPGARPPAIVQVWEWIKPVVRDLVEQGLGAIVDVLFGAETAPVESGRLAFADLDVGRLALAGPATGTAQITRGRAVVRIDLTRFTPAPPLDKYAAATLLWEQPPPWPQKPNTPALELQIAGLGPEQCDVPGGRCPGNSLGLVVRWSASIAAYDPNRPTQAPCGEGINARNWLPIGPSKVFDVLVEWGPGFVRATTPTGASWQAKVGAAAPGFGLFYAGVPGSKGIGWERPAWTLQPYGGAAALVDIAPVGTQPPLGTCP